MRIIICLLLVLLFSCSSKEERDTNTINACKDILRNQIQENKRILLYIERNEEWEFEGHNRKLMFKMNDMLEKSIDISFTQSHLDTIQLKRTIAELQNKYDLYLDSLSGTKFIKWKSYLIQDLLAKIKFKLVYSSKNSSEINYFFTIQDILIKHNMFLYQIRHLLAPNGFDRIGESGFQTVIVNENNITKVRFHFQLYRSKNIKFSPVKIIQLKNSEDQLIEINSSKIEGNDLMIETNKLEKGNYEAEIHYSFMHNYGDRDEITLYPKFTIW